MSDILFNQWFVLPVQAVCSTGAALMVKVKLWNLFDTFAPLIRKVLLLILSQNIIYLGIKVLLVED